MFKIRNRLLWKTNILIKMIKGFVSAKYILAKLYRDLNINEEINESSVWEWIAEALSMIGAYSQYEEISHCLHLVGGKAKLPCGFEKLVDINYKGYPVYWATNTNAHNYQCHNCRIPNLPTGVNNSTPFTFYVNDSYIITNINDEHPTEEADLCIVYLGIPTDEEGIPLIPDDVYYFKALAAYITHMMDYADWRRGKTTDKVFEYSERQWLWYVNAARGAGNMPNVQQLENLKNVIKRMMSINNDYKRGFTNFNSPEHFNI